MVGTPAVWTEMDLSIAGKICVSLRYTFRYSPGRVLQRAGIGFLALLSLTAQAEELRGFILSDTDLDSITAAGVAIVAESSSLTSGLGPEGVSDSVATTQVDPEAGFAEASGYAAGVDGSDGHADVWVFGEDVDLAFHTEAQSGGFEEGQRLTTVSAYGFLSIGAAGITGGSEASSQSGYTFSDSYTELAVARENVSANGRATVDSVGIGSLAASAVTSVQESWAPNTHYLRVEASGTGSDITDSSAVVSTSAQNGPVTVNIWASSEGASTRGSHAIAEAKVITMPNMMIAAARGTSTLQGRVMLQPSAATEIDVEGGLFRATNLERENKSYWRANSTTTAIIRMVPGM